MSSLIGGKGPFAAKNTRLFVWFTTFYNARAYYPVLAILFTDLGLKLEQYLMLNAVWAVAIVALEVPSGALADTIGRKRLLLASSVLMVMEMTVLLFAPKDGGMLLFILCLVNRFLSGASEAAASGADEAIAYDSLPDTNDKKSAWNEVLATAMRWRACGFLIAMTAGSLLYDPTWLNSLLPDGSQLSLELAHRLPVAMVLLQALICVAISLNLDEEKRSASKGNKCLRAWKLTLQTARTAFTTRSIAAVLLAGVLIDVVARNFATIISEYYRIILIPEWAFGVLGSIIAIGNWFIPGIAARVNRRYNSFTALLIGGVFTAIGCWFLVPAWPWVGILPAALLMMMLGYISFTVSGHLHAVSSSEQRATLLSVKGLVFNLGYGTYSMIFSLVVAGAANINISDTDPLQISFGLQAILFSLVIGAWILLAWQKHRALR